MGPFIGRKLSAEQMRSRYSARAFARSRERRSPDSQDGRLPGFVAKFLDVGVDRRNRVSTRSDGRQLVTELVFLRLQVTAGEF